MNDQKSIAQALESSQLVTRADLQTAMAESADSGQSLGDILINKGLLSERQFTQCLSKIASVPWVSLYHVQFTRELLNCIPPQLAEKHCVLPIYVRKERGGKEVLFVAMQDPHDAATLEALRQAADMPVKAMIAPPSEIRRAIDIYYFGRSPQAVESARQIQAPAKEEEVVLSRGWSAPPHRPHAPQRKEQVSQPDVLQDESPKQDVRMVTLTLLDGTTMKLPAAGTSHARAPDVNDSLTATDLIDALSAKAEGADVSEVLTDARWETLFGTLLTLLIRKGLIADWEFIDEWKQRSS
jgi:type IV pilus assembly protein PilB